MEVLDHQKSTFLYWTSFLLRLDQHIDILFLSLTAWNFN